MPFTVFWDDINHTVVRIDLTDPLTWDQAFAAERSANAMTDLMTREVSLILNFSGVNELPPNALTQIKTLMANIHPRTECVMLVGMNVLLRALQNTLNSIYETQTTNSSRKTIFAKDIHEARTILEQWHKLPSA